MRYGKYMLSISTSFKCRSCKSEFTLITEDIEKMNKGRYLVCPYCNSRRLDKQKATDDLRECMMARSYKRNGHGALVQK